MDGVRAVAKLLGMPGELAQRIPFPGPALAARIVGEVTEARLATVRAATAIVPMHWIRDLIDHLAPAEHA